MLKLGNLARWRPAAAAACDGWCDVRCLPWPATHPPPLPSSPRSPAVVPGNPLDDVKLLVGTVGSLLRANALRAKDSKSVNVSFGSKSNEEKLQMAN